MSYLLEFSLLSKVDQVLHRFVYFDISCCCVPGRSGWLNSAFVVYVR